MAVATRAVKLGAAVLACWLAGCGRVPESMAVPEQYRMPAGPEPAAGAEAERGLVAMGDEDVEAHIVEGVVRGEAGEPGRWTRERAVFRIAPDEVDVEYVMHFFIPETTYRVTGPVTVRVRVNGVQVGAPVFRGEGGHEFRCAMPAGVLKEGEEARVEMEVSPPYVSAGDGARLGVLLFEIGFKGRGA